MTSLLAPVGIATLGSLAVQTMRQLSTGDFLRELCGGNDKPAESTPDVTEPSALDLSRAVPAFIEKLRELLPADVDAAQPIVLKEDGWGGVVVDGEHPDRLAIEDLLAADEKIRAEFQTLARAATLERDKASAVSGQSLGEFRLRIEGDTAAIGFE